MSDLREQEGVWIGHPGHVTEGDEFSGYFVAEEDSMRFRVVAVGGWPQGGGGASYQDDECGRLDGVEGFWKAQPMIEGWVKWDGCMDLDVGGHGESYRDHFCGLHDALSISRALRLVYEHAEKLIPRFDRELSGVDKPTED